MRPFGTFYLVWFSGNGHLKLAAKCSILPVFCHFYHNGCFTPSNVLYIQIYQRDTNVLAKSRILKYVLRIVMIEVQQRTIFEYNKSFVVINRPICDDIQLLNMKCMTKSWFMGLDFSISLCSIHLLIQNGRHLQHLSQIMEQNESANHQLMFPGAVVLENITKLQVLPQSCHNKPLRIIDECSLCLDLMTFMG